MNLFGISSIILSLSGLLFSFIVFRSDVNSRINRYWFISCIFFSLWSFSLYEVTSTRDISVALAWQYILDVSAIFLPATYVLFLSEFLHYKNHSVRVALMVGAILLSIFSFSNFFKVGMTTFGEFYWINPGSLYIAFPVYFVVYGSISLFLMIRKYLQVPRGTIEKAQIRNMVFGGIMGYGGGLTNFFPQFFSAYPYGNYFVIFYSVGMV
jgi:hypothetical protein